MAAKGVDPHQQSGSRRPHPPPLTPAGLSLADIEIAYAADPVDITFLVQDALDRYALILDDSDVMVDTSGNTVTLTGHVRTWAEHDAVAAAWMASGVMDVVDELYITG
jgi:osmotically-inducible protein OsmY